MAPIWLFCRYWCVCGSCWAFMLPLCGILCVSSSLALSQLCSRLCSSGLVLCRLVCCSSLVLACQMYIYSFCAALVWLCFGSWMALLWFGSWAAHSCPLLGFCLAMICMGRQGLCVFIVAWLSRVIWGEECCAFQVLNVALVCCLFSVCLCLAM